MLPLRTARPSYAPPLRRSRPGRTLPALALGVATLALTLPTTLPADASPAAPVSAVHLTPAAQQAGLEVGNATMGWRERGTERAVLQHPSGLLRYGAAERSSTSSFTPEGVLRTRLA